MRFGVIGRQTQRASVRRVYTAKLEGHQSGHMTVALYEGDGAEEAWNEHLTKYEAVRHPNIIQLLGLVKTRRLRGMVFHDELIPYHQFFDRFEHSPILSAYITGYCITEFKEATDYIEDVFRESSIDDDNLQIWIQPSTGELCLDLVPGGPETTARFSRWWNTDVPRLENVSLDAPDSVDMIISSFSEDQYHELCSKHPIARFQYLQLSTQHPVGLGVFRLDSQYETCMRITEPLQILPEAKPRWDHYGAQGELLPNSYDSREISTLKLQLRLSFWSYQIPNAWLAQANHIFAELEELAHVKDYGASLTSSMLELTSAISHKAIYLFVLPRISALASNRMHIYTNGQSVQRIGPSTSLVPLASAQRTPESSDFLQFTSRLGCLGGRGVKAFMKGCDDFTKARGFIRIVGRLQGSWFPRCLRF
ncbi:hypothetical protein MSAN_01517200 [Mycena sanguinolenta]|uniref:Protein kinase domain-containing protein n=1 Tax=Mycena sanguinolenta TaxID=230812 RepID=A0A8H7CYX5_9AGAR|nr:hypothetical protein MSAN_01517200 [Mycena sanguinolenta]